MTIVVDPPRRVPLWHQGGAGVVRELKQILGLVVVHPELVVKILFTDFVRLDCVCSDAVKG